MAELMNFANGVLFWDVSFFRGVHARELEAPYGYHIWCFSEEVC